MQSWLCTFGKKLTVTGFAVVCLFLLVACSGRQGPATVKEPLKTPRIVFEKLTHDFGNVQPGMPLTYSFIFKNDGNADLFIEKVKAG